MRGLFYHKWFTALVTEQNVWCNNDQIQQNKNTFLNIISLFDTNALLSLY